MNGMTGKQMDWYGWTTFGHSGAKRVGYRVGGESRHRSAIKVADKRSYQGYRSDKTLDIRQMSGTQALAGL